MPPYTATFHLYLCLQPFDVLLRSQGCRRDSTLCTLFSHFVIRLCRTIFIHWLNQTYNASMNYANRNASNPVSNQLLAEVFRNTCNMKHVILPRMLMYNVVCVGCRPCCSALRPA